MGKCFDRTMMARLTGVCVALAMNACANVGQRDAQSGAAGSAEVSGVPAASASVSDQASAGQQLPIGANEGTPLRKAPPLVYRVKRGDTLARIAQHHHCSVKQLQVWNGLKGSSRLKLGQVLHVASPETVRAVNAANVANVANVANTATTANTVKLANAPNAAGANPAAANAVVSPAPAASLVARQASSSLP